MKCPKCFGDRIVKNVKKFGLDIKQRYYCHSCRHMFYVSIDSPVPKQKRFSVGREILRQIIHADIEEDKHRKVKEYSF